MIPIIPELFLLVLIVGLPQLSETVYTPSLPDIAHALGVSDSWVEYTLTIYLFGFSVGTLLWGKLSDRFGRRPCVLAGLILYILGCIGCFYSTSIMWLMISRFIQACGGSTGSVLGQAICRDAFHGSERGKVYSTIGSALSFSPAVGPIIGGLFAQWYGWSSIFLFLTFFGAFVLLLTFLRLPETHHTHMRGASEPLLLVARKMIRDYRVLAFSFLVAGCNGIAFSYYAEGPFYLIEMLHLSPFIYGVSFIVLAACGMLGGFISRYLHHSTTSHVILNYGLWVMVAGGAFFAAMIPLCILFGVPFWIITTITIVSMAILFAGIGLMIPNVLSLALEEYRQSVGTASALFGCFYYAVISLFTLGMGLLHSGTLIPMPIYFFLISIAMLFVSRTWIEQRIA